MTQERLSIIAWTAQVGAQYALLMAPAVLFCAILKMDFNKGR